MLKSLLVLVALAGTASADRVYDVKAVRRGGNPSSCLAEDRMMKDRHVIRIKDDGTTYVDGKKWETVAPDPDLLITFHRRPGQHTWLYMDLYVNQRGLAGTYVLVGLTPKRKSCFDLVYLDGTRR